ncbi:MAG: methionine--tRNA ligase [Acidimicrobiia bacterium]|nr:methionine--tRNA ligase [Acidimicrobiia bacterium]
MGSFYITTPIYYPNALPHIGHAYTTVAADFIARYHRLRGDDTFFLTGTDEHGRNVANAAENAGLEPQEYVDQIEHGWKDVWQGLDISFDDYIRTTQPRHVDAVLKLLTAVHDNGRDDIYMDRYEGLYCVSCEAYYVEADLVDGNCPVHGRPVEPMSEDNYFFRLSAYEDRLLAHYEANPQAVQPETRRNEVLSLIRGGLRDFSISRSSFSWGIPLPWDPAHVTYVWFDALTNYITAAGYADDPDRFARLWPANVHLMAKDIIRFHAVYWPAMLMAAGVEPPQQVWSHGYLLVGGEKMSKTNLTGIHPFELSDHFGVDAYRYYFMREISFGKDGSFSWEGMETRYKADLANGLGNLASRVLAMVGSYFDGEVPAPVAEGHDGGLPQLVADVASRYDDYMLALELNQALTAVWEIVGRANEFLVEEEPWKLGEGKADELATVLYVAAETLRVLAVMIFPIMPQAAQRLWSQLGVAEQLSDQRIPDATRWGGLVAGTRVTKGDSLFPRLEE